MFMRSSMEKDLHILEDALQSLKIFYVSDDWRELQSRIIILQLQQRFEDAVLTVTQNDQLRRIPARDLARKFTPNGAAGAGDEHTPSAQRFANHFLVDASRFPAQEVSDVDLAQAAYADLAADQFIDSGHCP